MTFTLERSLTQRAILLVTLLAIFSGCTSLPRVIPPSRYKLYTLADGMYRLTAATLASAGIDPAQISAPTLQLFRGDHEVAIRVQGQAQNLALEFYGQASDSPYSQRTAYWLRWGHEPGKRMREVDATALSPSMRQAFQETIHFREPRLYIPQAAENVSPWYWQSLSAPMTTTITLTLPSAISAEARLKLNLWGNTQSSGHSDHHLRVLMNDVPVADQTWDGIGTHVVDAQLPGTIVRDGVNTVRLVAPGDTGASGDVILLESADVTFSRRLRAEHDSLQFSGTGATYQVEGFSTDSIDLFDLTDPLEPVHLTYAKTSAGSISFAANASGARRWAALSPAAFKTVPGLVPMSTDVVRSKDRRADYLIVAPPEFISALEPLVRWREKQGLAVVTLALPAIYDEFAQGDESPQALKTFLEFATAHWGVRFLLFVGKASYDYRDYTNGPNKNLVPTFLIATAHLGQVASDDWFIPTSSSDPRPRLALGRIPAKSTNQVTRVVEKIIAFESAPSDDAWTRRALFAADDKDAIFAAMANGFASALPPKYETTKVYLGERSGDFAAARSEIVSQWNAGAALVTYVGHGSIDKWAVGPLFSSDLGRELKNGNRLPILFTPTCLDGLFYHPQKDSLAEELLFNERGGIIAGFVPTGLSLPEPQQKMMRALFQELFARPEVTLGEAILHAKQMVDIQSPDSLEVIQTFELLGDPALRFKAGH